MKKYIYEDDEIYIQREESEIPWVKIFTKANYKELGDLPIALRKRVWEVYDIIELVMREFYKPTKINMASFGNMLPQVHIHVMARFEDDSFFPNPMWGEKLREAKLHLGDENEFFDKLCLELNRIKS